MDRVEATGREGRDHEGDMGEAMNAAQIEGTAITIAHATRWAAAVELIPAHEGEDACDHDHMTMTTSGSTR